jgi:acyl-coenzyme A thioesterase PaaI-like protein
MAGETLVAQTRALIETLRTTDFDEAGEAGVDLAALAEQLSAVNASLDPHVVHGEIRAQAALRMSEVSVHVEAGSLPDLTHGSPEVFFRYSPVIGPLNPIAPPFRFWYEDGRVYGEGRFGTAYNGPPTAAHGGWVAAVMDELLGLTGVMTGNHGFTGTLSVRYENLTPLHTDLTMEAWIDRTEGRKSFITGTIGVEGMITARAEGIFIRPSGS